MRGSAERFVKVIPALLTLFVPFFSGALAHIPGMSRMMPMLVLISIYYWGIFNPRSLPYIFLFVLGLLQDTLAGLPLGISSFANVLFAWIVSDRAHITSNMSFKMIWRKFAVLSFAIIMLEWLIICLYYNRLYPFSPELGAWISTLLAYPLLHAFFNATYRLITET